MPSSTLQDQLSTCQFCAHPCYLAADVPWTSGAVYPDDQRAATEQRIAAENAAEQQRLLELKSNRHLPLVYMDIEIKARHMDFGTPWYLAGASPEESQI